MCVCVPDSTSGNMFNEDQDWNDEQDPEVLSKTLLKNTPKTNSSTNVKVHVDIVNVITR